MVQKGKGSESVRVQAPSACNPASPLSKRTLVLNITFQPLAITNARRAIVLVLDDKAEVVCEGEGLIRSPSMSFAVPSVVRLCHMAHVPYRNRAPLHRWALFARDSFRCQYCGHSAECIDHVHPRSRGGDHSWENVVACCRACNVAKGDSLLSESKFKLQRKPFAPDPMVVAAAPHETAPIEWLDYLPEMTSLPA